MRYHYLPASMAAHDRELTPPVAAPPAFRVIVAARAAADAALDRVPDVMRLGRLIETAGGRATPPTYAMAEEIATATLIESVALRFTLVDGRRGVALWWDWRWHGAIVRELGTLTRERLELLITTGSAEVPTYVCGRCLREGVKLKQDGQMYAHKRANWHPPWLEACK